MGVARSIEQRLEGLVEGFFAKVFRSGLHPVEVGRRMVREMGDNKTISVRGVYAPNDFHIVLGPEDYQRFSQMESRLVQEFSELAIEAAKEHRWNLMGLPRIRFVESQDVGKGEFRVEASLAADPQRAPEISTRAGADPATGAAVPSEEARRLGFAGAQAHLVALDSRGKATQRIAIARTPVTIGRLSTSDVVLSDSNVSRRHAELRRDGLRWVIVDLGSTNGTLVNGKLVKEHELSDGDRLSFGTSELVFQTSE